MKRGRLSEFISAHLTPENRLAEVMCGLVMVLGFTATTQAAFTDITPRQLLIGVLGCNTAWGIVDAVTYILGNMLVRAQYNRKLMRLRGAGSPAEAREIAADILSFALDSIAEPARREQAVTWFLEGSARMALKPTRAAREDFLTALACFLVVFLSTLPVAVPFMLLANKVLALRLSNVLALGMLFGIGWQWAKLVEASRWWTGFLMLLLGAILVAVTVALGG
jgi:VIT1/CCC1 family predicted Fe2+/Mn2+ transporter